MCLLVFSHNSRMAYPICFKLSTVTERHQRRIISMFIFTQFHLGALTEGWGIQKTRVLKWGEHERVKRVGQREIENNESKGSCQKGQETATEHAAGIESEKRVTTWAKIKLMAFSLLISQEWPHRSTLKKHIT